MTSPPCPNLAPQRRGDKEKAQEDTRERRGGGGISADMSARRGGGGVGADMCGGIGGGVIVSIRDSPNRGKDWGQDKYETNIGGMDPLSRGAPIRVGMAAIFGSNRATSGASAKSHFITEG
jgi:hypothetical protein